MSRSHRPSPPYVLVGAVSWLFVRVGFRLRIVGPCRPPTLGGYVLASNHVSNLDPWPLGMPLYPSRYLRFMAKSELYWPPLGWFLDACGAFKVRRGQHDEEAVATAVRLARDGHAIVMFPEGTRRRKGIRKKYEARWRAGAARIALEAGVPLVPAAVAGTDRLSRLARWGVTYGEPIPVDDLAGLDPVEAAATATERLRAEIERLEASLGR
ncbi:MAG: 1-acyl-sn-glycerol-3-phosphate acyltransferase [Thermoleophilia bacterium]|nr:1-acyl-sn-glycerol-3-phosphate acyltransferase [Thermoleophilia bacterium]